MRHNGKELVFDWSTTEPADNSKSDEHISKKVKLDDESEPSSPAKVQWAAFYSDCEHEVLEVTSGHRLTLTYNLFVAPGGGSLAGEHSALDATSLSLYKELESALSNDDFFPSGHVLGVGLSHTYAHMSAAPELLPSGLKGVDMYIYDACMSLGLNCYLRPVVRFDGREGGRITYVGDHFGFVEGGDISSNTSQRVEDDLRDHWQSTRVDPSRLTWLRRITDFDEPTMAHTTVSSCVLHTSPLRYTLTSMVQYGNEPGTDVIYSAAALFIHIPSFEKRGNGSRKVPWLPNLIGDDRSETSDDEDDEEIDEAKQLYEEFKGGIRSGHLMVV